MTGPPVTALIALGSNLGDRQASLGGALQRLGAVDGVEVGACSTFHETEPVGPAGQGKYLNAAAVVETTLLARELLEAMLRVEREMGRVRGDSARWGPRVIDLDLLMYGDAVIAEPGLTTPHPLMHERRFVLEPLVEVAPQSVHPVLGLTVAEILAGLIGAGE